VIPSKSSPTFGSLRQDETLYVRRMRLYVRSKFSLEGTLHLKGILMSSYKTFGLSYQYIGIPPIAYKYRISYPLRGCWVGRINVFPEEHQNSESLFTYKQPCYIINYTTTTMPEDNLYDSTCKGTIRPSKDLIWKQGDKFKPMQLPNECDGSNVTRHLVA
jgi:hypothetical protein